jgi:hypothetical protein
MNKYKKSIRIYFENKDTIYYINDNENDKMYCHNKYDLKEHRDKFNYFHLFKGYNEDLEGLNKFLNDFKIWTNQLNYEFIRYDEYQGHKYAVLNTFKKYSQKKLDKIDIEQITPQEIYFQEKIISNSAILYLDTDIKNKEIKLYSYDFSSYFASLLVYENDEMSNSKFEFEKYRLPIESGILDTNFKFDIKENKFLEYGYYKIHAIEIKNLKYKKINNFLMKSKDLEINGLWMFSYELNVLLKYKELLKLELILNGPRYYYNNDTLKETKPIFYDWYSRTMFKKRKFTDNKLCKHLLSSIIGCLIQYNRLNVDEYEISNYKYCKMEDLIVKGDEVDYFVLDTYRKGENKYNFELCDVKRPYVNNNFSRLKSTFASYQRAYMIEFLINYVNIDDIVRIQTDGFKTKNEVIFDENDYYMPKKEGKTTYLFRSLNDFDKY